MALDIAGPMVPDTPLRENPLLLDDLPLDAGLRPTLDRLADRLANLVRSAPLTSPILVSGEWGSGKTTLLRAVCRKLADAALTQVATPTVMFEAWQYESAHALLPALMRRMWEAAPPMFRAKKAGKALLWELVRWAASTTARIGAPVLGAALGLPPGLEDELDIAKVTKRAAKTLGDVKPPADPVDELRDAFARLVQAAWPDGTPVVFIDDLDRCNPADAVTLLDAVRTFAACAERLRVRFVVALDRSVVTQAISAKFANVRGYDGNRYLEKIFPLEFHVPSPQHAEIKDIITALAAPLEQRERQRAVFALTEALSPACFANTRLIKRSFNRYCLLRYFELGQIATAEIDKQSLQWIAAIERWPRLRTLQQRRRRDFWTAAQKQMDDPDLQALIVEPGFLQWLHLHGWPGSTDALERFDDADARLRQFGM
jgi:hypothetical protein